MADENVIPWTQSPDGVSEVYANMVHLVWSLDDVRIRFGQLVNSPDSLNPGMNFKSVSEERAAITLAWRGAKMLRDNLSKLIQAYEEVNGPIKTDPKLPPAPAI